MTKEIISYRGSVRKISCLSCAREKGEVSFGDIVKSTYFDAHQDYDVPIPGFLIISSRRHIQSVTDFTEEEQQDFIKFLCRIRSSLKQVLDINIVYLVQKEDPARHFHLWLFPRFEWMEKKFGTKIESITSIMEFAKKNLKTESDLNEVGKATQKLKQFFSTSK